MAARATSTTKAAKMRLEASARASSLSGTAGWGDERVGARAWLEEGAGTVAEGSGGAAAAARREARAWSGARTSTQIRGAGRAAAQRADREGAGGPGSGAARAPGCGAGGRTRRSRRRVQRARGPGRDSPLVVRLSHHSRARGRRLATPLEGREGPRSGAPRHRPASARRGARRRAARTRSRRRGATGVSGCPCSHARQAGGGALRAREGCEASGERTCGGKDRGWNPTQDLTVGDDGLDLK